LGRCRVNGTAPEVPTALAAVEPGMDGREPSPEKIPLSRDVAFNPSLHRDKPGGGGNALSERPEIVRTLSIKTD